MFWYRFRDKLIFSGDAVALEQRGNLIDVIPVTSSNLSYHYEVIGREGLRWIKQSIQQLFDLPENIYTFNFKSALKKQHANPVYIIF